MKNYNEITLDNLVLKINGIINNFSSEEILDEELSKFLYSIIDLSNELIKKKQNNIPKEYKESIIKNIQIYLHNNFTLPIKKIRKQIHTIDNITNLKTEIKKLFSTSNLTTVEDIKNEIIEELDVDVDNSTLNYDNSLKRNIIDNLNDDNIKLYELVIYLNQLKIDNQLNGKLYILLNLYILVKYYKYHDIKQLSILETNLYETIYENINTSLKNKNIKDELTKMYIKHTDRYADVKYYLDGCDVVHDVVHKSLYFNKLIDLKKSSINNLDIASLFHNKVKCDQHEIGKKRHDAISLFVKFLNDNGLSFSIPEEIQLSKINGEDYIMFYFEILKMYELFAKIDKYIYRESGSNLTHEKLLSYYTSLDSSNKQKFKDECVNKSHNKNLSEQLFNLLFDNPDSITYDFNVDLNTLSLFDACKKSVNNIDELQDNYSIFKNVYGYYNYHVFSKIYNGKNHHIVIVIGSSQTITNENILAVFCINGDVPINFLLNENNKFCNMNVFNDSHSNKCKVLLERTGDAKNTYFINMDKDILKDLKGDVKTLFSNGIDKCLDNGYYFNEELNTNVKQLLLFGNKTIGDLIFSQYNDIYCLTTVDSLVADSVLYDFLSGNNDKLPSVWRYRKGWNYREGQSRESPKSLTLLFFTQLASVIAFLKYYIGIIDEFNIDVNDEKKQVLKSLHELLINLFFGEMTEDDIYLYNNHMSFNRINNMLRFIITFKFQSKSININYNLTYNETQEICENFYYMLFLNEIEYKFNLINNYLDNLINIYYEYLDYINTNNISSNVITNADSKKKSNNSNKKSNNSNKKSNNSNKKSNNKKKSNSKIKSKLMKSNDLDEKYNYFINKFRILPRLNIILYINSIASYNNNIYDSIVDEFTLKNLDYDSPENIKKQQGFTNYDRNNNKTNITLININTDKKIINKVRKTYDDGKKTIVKIYKIIELHVKNINESINSEEIPTKDYILYLNNNEIINNYNYGSNSPLSKISYFYEDSSGNKIGNNLSETNNPDYFIQINDDFKNNYFYTDTPTNKSNIIMIFIEKSLNDELLQILIYRNSPYLLTNDIIKDTLGNDSKLTLLVKYNVNRKDTYIYLLEYPNTIGNLFNLLSYDFILKNMKNTYYILIKIIKYFMDELIKYVKPNNYDNDTDVNDIVKNIIVEELIKNKFINNTILYILHNIFKDGLDEFKFSHLSQYSSLEDNITLNMDMNNMNDMKYIDENNEDNLYNEYKNFIKYFFMEDNIYNNKYFLEDEEIDDEFKYVEEYENDINNLIADKKNKAKIKKQEQKLKNRQTTGTKNTATKKTPTKKTKKRNRYSSNTPISDTDTPQNKKTRKR